MISFINPEEQAPSIRPPKFDFHDLAKDEELLASLPTSVEIIFKAHRDFTTRKVEEALIAKFGEVPPLDMVARHCYCFFDANNVAHYVWLDKKPELGDKIDPADMLCVIAPPKFDTLDES